jgi:DNA-binding transcriptional ArsR family regulator
LRLSRAGAGPDAASSTMRRDDVLRGCRAGERDILTSSRPIVHRSHDVNRTPSPLIPADFDQRYERGFGLLAFVCNRFVLNHMRRIGIELDIDLESAMIWGILAHMNNLPSLPMNADPMEVLNEIGMKSSGDLAPLRLAELTMITGLPKETVRRKLERLRAAGKVDRTADGKWIFVRSAIGEAEREFTRQTVLLLLQTAESLQRILERVEVRSNGK